MSTRVNHSNSKLRHLCSDRNPQTFVENIFNAKAGDYRPATQSVHRGAAQSSRVILPVVK